MSAGAGGGGGKAWHSLAGISVFFVIMSIAGIVLLPIGVNKANTNSAYDPVLDFNTIPYENATGCTITSISHVAEQRQDKSPYCVDVYTYSFVYYLGGNNFVTYTSGTEEHKRTGPGKCDNSNSIMVASAYEVGATPTCYKPTTAALPIDASFAMFYNCGNDECMKVMNPSIAWDSANQNADLFLILGGVFTAVGLTGLILFGGLTIKYYKASSA